MEGGSASENGQIKGGDSLVSVSGIDVRKCSRETLGDMLRGEPGSAIRLGFERTDSVTSRAFFFELDLKRDSTIARRLDTAGQQQQGGRPLGGKHQSTPTVGALTAIIAPNTPPPASPVHDESMLTPMSLITPMNITGKSRSLRALERVVNECELPLSPKAPLELARSTGRASAADAESELLSLRTEVTSLKTELKQSRAEARDSVAQVKQLKESAEHELAFRAAEAKRVSSILEREERSKQLWREEVDKRKEAEARLLAAEAAADELNQRLVRSEAQVKVMTVTIDGFSKDEISSQVLVQASPSLLEAWGFRVQGFRSRLLIHSGGRLTALQQIDSDRHEVAGEARGVAAGAARVEVGAQYAQGAARGERASA